MNLIVFSIFSCAGLLEGRTTTTTTASPLDCYTQPPGRDKDNRVMTCLDKYAIIPGNLFCQKNVKRHRLSLTEISEIETKHNEIRSTVSPKAASMLSLMYNFGLERTAQIWAEMCHLQPSKQSMRFRPGSFMVGENVFVSETDMTWSDVIDIWAQEKSVFTYGSGGNDASLISNYTQIVSARSSAVGCSKAFCTGQYFFVCHYVPAMDYGNTDKPYESSNQSCSQCLNCTNSLCDCRGIICLNGAELNFTTCDCGCITGVDAYTPPTCELKCVRNSDDPKCGTTFNQTACSSSFETMLHCPWLCNVCPYAGYNYSERSAPLPWERNRTECPSQTTSHTFGTSTQTTVTVHKGGKRIAMRFFQPMDRYADCFHLHKLKIHEHL